jgi:hypothetical protein
MNEFTRAYHDFTQHFVEINEDQIEVYAEAAEKFWGEIEKEATKLEVTVDYYLAEFV